MKTDIDQMTTDYRDGYSLEQPFYRSPDVFEQDMERLLTRRWLLADHESRIPDKGDYFLFNIGNESIIIVKRDYPNRCNWKLVVENFLECYHCAPSHPEYCSVHPPDQLLALGAGPEEAMEKYQPILDEWTKKTLAMGHPVPEFERDENSLDLAQISRVPINDRDFVMRAL